MPNDSRISDQTPPPAPEGDPASLWALVWRVTRLAMESYRNLICVLVIFGFIIVLLYLLEHAR